MRFAFSVALKYLIPRRKQLSVSIISVVSVLVISLVVWLAIVFLSVTEGIEKKWLDELTTLNAPLKVRPKDAYFQSYYYLVDSISASSNYTLKSLTEKLSCEKSNPYDPTVDVEPPNAFPEPLLNTDGSLKDLAKEAKEAILSLNGYSGLRVNEFEAGFGQLHLTLLQNGAEVFLSQVSYIIPYDKDNQKFTKLLLPPRKEDQTHLLSMKEKTGEAILLPKGFQKNKVLLGDGGYISYYTHTTSGMQEQRLPIYVSGFYDPGMMPLGNKMIFAEPKVANMLKGNILSSDEFFGNGFAVWLNDLKDVQRAKEIIEKNLETKGLSSFFTVESFSDYEFSRPFLEQLKSDKALFTLIAIIILLVACSNIISMLLLLVNDKKKEIAVLQSMGATSKSIVSIFGIAGMLTGSISCIIGTTAAFFTLKHLQSLVQLLSFLQGREAFQSAFFGTTLPNALSMSSLIFIVSATFIVSFLAGVIPALKATKIRPSEILKSE